VVASRDNVAAEVLMLLFVGCVLIGLGVALWAVWDVLEPKAPDDPEPEDVCRGVAGASSDPDDARTLR
jgi:hypothetical protein